MDRLPVLVRARPPGVVPQSAPVALLLIADQVRDHPTFSLQLGEPAEDGEAGGASANDANLTNHFLSVELLLLTWNTRYHHQIGLNYFTAEDILEPDRITGSVDEAA